jgi:hypothetical protein
VGNFVVFADGHPVIIDVGRPTYTRQTFSRDRYKIWAMRSEYHNLPSINGVAQRAGRQYEARDVRYSKSDSGAQLAMDIAPSYPAQADVGSWTRTVALARGRHVEVRDDFQLGEPTTDIVQHLVTPCPVEQTAEGTLLLRIPSTNRAIQLAYEPSDLRVTVETLETDDDKLQSIWGPRLYRILLAAPQATDAGSWTMRFTRKL